MGGRGESVSYTRFFVAEMDEKKRAKLKDDIERIIQGATLKHPLTIIALQGGQPLPKVVDYKDFP